MFLLKARSNNVLFSPIQKAVVAKAAAVIYARVGAKTNRHGAGLALQRAARLEMLKKPKTKVSRVVHVVQSGGVPPDKQKKLNRLLES